MRFTKHQWSLRIQYAAYMHTLVDGTDEEQTRLERTSWWMKRALLSRLRWRRCPPSKQRLALLLMHLPRRRTCAGPPPDPSHTVPQTLATPCLRAKLHRLQTQATPCLLVHHRQTLATPCRPLAFPRPCGFARPSDCFVVAIGTGRLGQSHGRTL